MATGTLTFPLSKPGGFHSEPNLGLTPVHGPEHLRFGPPIPFWVHSLFAESTSFLHIRLLSYSHRGLPNSSPFLVPMSTLNYSSIISERSRIGRGPTGVSQGETTTKFKVENLSFWYGAKQALHDISMDIPQHSVMALIGPSGCGKSTFLRCLNRMNDFIESARQTGHIKLDGEDIHGRGINLVALRQRVGMVFQRSNPFPKTIYENVVFGPRVAGLSNRTQLMEICERCLRSAALWDEVKDRLNEPALSLSGGQSQRLCIARALATNPEVILLDEPASALDPVSTSRIEDLIFELKRDYTIVIVTHNMQQAARVSDNTAFFFQGRVIEVGSTDQMYTRPQVKQTEDYITGRFG